MGRSDVQHHRRTLTRVLAAISLVVTLVSCADPKDVAGQSVLPDVPVSYRIDRTSSEGVAIASPLSCLLVTSPRAATDRIGIAGLLVVHGLSDSFTAYDAQCPLCYPSVAAIAPDSIPAEDTLLSATCTRCGARYDLTFGIGNLISDNGNSTTLKHYSVFRRDRFLVIEH